MQSMSNCELFPLFQQVQRILQPVSEECVLFLGQSKVGVSTCYNWIAGLKLIGVEMQGEICYNSQNKQAAQTNNSFKPLTLIPNVFINQSMCLVDVPTIYYDSQDQNQKRTIISLYAFDTLFRNCKKFKFIIVVDQSIMRQRRQALKKFQFQSLISLLKLNNMDQEMQEQVINSVYLIVNKSNDQKSFSNFINKILQSYTENQSKNSIDYQILKNVTSENRIMFLPTANQGKQPPTPQQIFNLTNWNSFNYYESCKCVPELGQLHLPFVISQTNKNLLEEAVRFKIQICSIYSKIIGQFINYAARQWKDGISSFTECFEHIQQIIPSYNCYSNEKYDEKVYMENKFNEEDEIANENYNKMQEMNKITEIYAYNNDQICQKQYEQDPRVYLDKINNCCRGILAIVKNTFAKSYKQQETIITFSFLVMRSLKEVATISHILPELFTDSHSKILTELQKMFQMPLNNLKIIFVFEMNEKTKHKMIEDVQVGDEYCQFLISYQNSDCDNELKICEQIIKISDTMAEVYSDRGQYTNALKKYLSVFKNYQKFISPYYDMLNSEQDEEKNIELKKGELNMKIMYTLLKIAKTVQNVGPQHRSYALGIYKQLNYVQLVCAIYQKNIQDESQQIRRQKLYRDYGKYCFDNGRFQQGIIQLQKALVLVHKDVVEYDKLYSMMLTAINGKKDKEDAFKRTIMDRKLIDFDDQLLDAIGQIEDNLQ